MTREEESRLVTAAKLGDREAVAALWEQFRGMAGDLAVRIARSRPGVDADDLTQEGYFGLLKAVEYFDPARGVRLSTYLHSCFRQRMIDHLRRHGGNPLHQLPSSTEQLSGLNSEIRGSADWDASRVEPRSREPAGGSLPADRDQVMECLKQLPPRDRLAIELRFGLLDGEARTLDRVGAALGVSRQRADGILNRALARMREKFVCGEAA